EQDRPPAGPEVDGGDEGVQHPRRARGEARRERLEQSLGKRNRAVVEEDREDQRGAEREEAERDQHRSALGELEVTARRRLSEHAQAEDPEQSDGDSIDDAFDHDGGERPAAAQLLSSTRRWASDQQDRKST